MTNMRYARVGKDTVLEIHYLNYPNRKIITQSGETLKDPTEKDYSDAGWLPVILPVVPENQVISGVVVNNGDNVSYSLRDKTPEELTAETDKHIRDMDDAVRGIIDKRVHWTASTMVAAKAEAGLPKAMAVTKWTEDLWTEFFTRSARLHGGEQWAEDMMDYSSFEEMPYTIQEVITE